jgi:hypothetical protein
LKSTVISRVSNSSFDQLEVGTAPEIHSSAAENKARFQALFSGYPGFVQTYRDASFNQHFAVLDDFSRTCKLFDHVARESYLRVATKAALVAVKRLIDFGDWLQPRGICRGRRR